MRGDLSGGAVMDILVWLRSLGLGKYEATFRVHFLGRSHLSLALERAGRFTPLSDLISALAKAEREGTMREKIRFFCRFSLPHFLREFENARTHCPNGGVTERNGNERMPLQPKSGVGGMTLRAIDEGSVRPCVATAWQANRLQNQWQGWEGLRPRSVQVRRVRYTWPWNTVLVLPPGSEPLMVSLGP